MEEIRIHHNQWCVFSTESQIIIITVSRGKQQEENKWVSRFCAEKNVVLGISCVGNNWMQLPHFIRQAQQFSEQACIKGLPVLDGNDYRAENIYAILGKINGINPWFSLQFAYCNRRMNEKTVICVRRWKPFCETGAIRRPLRISWGFIDPPSITVWNVYGT